MPGVGVAPRGKGFPSVFASGMPGVGVAPFGTFALKEFVSGKPGALELTVIGLPENSGGAFVCDLAFAEFIKTAVLPFVFSALVQAALESTAAATAQNEIKKNFLDIKKKKTA